MVLRMPTLFFLMNMLYSLQLVHLACGVICGEYLKVTASCIGPGVCGCTVLVQVSGGFTALMSNVDAIIRKVCTDQSIAKNAMITSANSTVAIGQNITYEVTV